MHRSHQHVEQTTDPAAGAYLLPYPLETLSRPVPLKSDRVTVGRSPNSGIVIDSNTVSRYHAVIVSRDSKYYIKDIHSRNGTWVNSDRISVRRLHHHDRVTFGDQDFIFLIMTEDDSVVQPDQLLDERSTIALRPEELSPSNFLACQAERARLELFPTPDFTLAPGTESERKPLSFFQRLGTPRVVEPEAPASQQQSRQMVDMHRAHHRLSLLYRLSERIRATTKPLAILDEGLDLLMEALPTAARALVMLRPAPDAPLKIVASRYRDSENPDVGDSDIRISRTLLTWVLTEKMALMTSDAAADNRLKDAESIRISHLNALICVPMMVSQRVIGIIYADFEDLLDPITQADVSFTAAVGHELAMSIANAQLQKTAIRNERMAAIGLTVSNLAHNIKNLTMLNQNALELMRIHLDRIHDEKADRCWKIIEKGFDRTSRLSLEMLEYVREEEITPVMTDINELIQANVDLFQQHLADKNGELTLSLDDTDPQWYLDPKQFQRALVNMVVNAVDAINAQNGGKIRISTQVDGTGRLMVSVIDNGCGIPPDKRQRIFDLFFTTKGTSGNGIGLPMVNKFVTASGGRLAVSSKLGVGSRFQMIFPPNR